MISEYEDGGLKMVDLRLFAQVLKLGWVKRFLDKGNEAKWKLFYNVQLRDWKAAYRLPFECTKISKLRVLEFKLLHRRLATNDFLKKINLRDNDLCNFCQFLPSFLELFGNILLLA